MAVQHALVETQEPLMPSGVLGMAVPLCHGAGAASATESAQQLAGPCTTGAASWHQPDRPPGLTSKVHVLLGEQVVVHRAMPPLGALCLGLFGVVGQHRPCVTVAGKAAPHPGPAVRQRLAALVLDALAEVALVALLAIPARTPGLLATCEQTRSWQA